MRGGDGEEEGCIKGSGMENYRCTVRFIVPTARRRSDKR